MNISVVQFNSKLGKVNFNLDKVEKIIVNINPTKTDILVFPEMVDTGYDMKTIQECAVTWKKNHLKAIKKVALKKEVAIIIGLSEKEDSQIFNTIGVIDKQGEFIFKYRKTHLVTISPICEQKTITPGENLGFFSLFGIKMGVMTCYELRFPEIARSLTLQGARVIFVPSAWPAVRKDHFISLLIARAIENQVFIVSANRVGTDADTKFAGNSMVIDPFGKILIRGSATDEIMLTSFLDLDKVNLSRVKIQALKERRPDLYRL